MASKKVTIFIPPSIQEAYEALLKESFLGPSGFFLNMLAEKVRERAEKQDRRPVGRPKRETDEERAARIAAEPADTPHPDQGDAFCGHNGMMVTRREAEAWCALMDQDENKREQVQKLKYYIPAHLRRVND